MKLLVLASLLAAAPAFADDPSTGPGPTMFVDEPGTPGENLPPAPPPPPEQAPVVVPAVKPAAAVGEAVVRVTAQSLSRLMGLAGESLVQARWLHLFSGALGKLKKHLLDNLGN